MYIFVSHNIEKYVFNIIFLSFFYRCGSLALSVKYALIESNIHHNSFGISDDGDLDFKRSVYSLSWEEHFSQDYQQRKCEGVVNELNIDESPINIKKMQLFKVAACTAEPEINDIGGVSTFAVTALHWVYVNTPAYALCVICVS